MLRLDSELLKTKKTDSNKSAARENHSATTDINPTTTGIDQPIREDN